MQAREQRGREWDREDERGRQGYGREGRHDWRPPSYKERQQTYPWGQQGQEGYFGEPPRPHAGIPGREGDRPGSGWERQSSGIRERESAGSGSHAGRGPRGYQRSDARIHEDICDRLTDHPAIDASEIEVTVKGCEVTLSGTVESRAVKHLVETMAETVPGVRDIHNQLQVTGRQQGSEQTQTVQQENGRTRM